MQTKKKASKKTAKKASTKSAVRKTAKKVAKKSISRLQRVLTTNFRTQGVKRIAMEKYEPIAKAINAVLQDGKNLTYTELVTEVKKRLQDFKGSVSWYVITVTRDLESRGKMICQKIKTRPFYSLKSE